MNEEFKKANESLPAEEKEQLQKYQKKGITKITQSVDQFYLLKQLIHLKRKE